MLCFTPIAIRLLACLAHAQGRVVTRVQLFNDVRGLGCMDDTRELHVYLKALRKKLEPEPTRPRYLLTEPGLGYR
jgi:two-component system KDP operon response regulator KdpE